MNFPVKSRLKSPSLTVTPLIAKLGRSTNINVLIFQYNQINLLFSYLCTKSNLEELRGHKVVPVMSGKSLFIKTILHCYNNIDLSSIYVQVHNNVY